MRWRTRERLSQNTAAELARCEAEQERILIEFEAAADKSDLLLFLMGWADWEVEKQMIRAEETKANPARPPEELRQSPVAVCQTKSTEVPTA
jgi:hypothetical protein